MKIKQLAIVHNFKIVIIELKIKTSKTEELFYGEKSM